MEDQIGAGALSLMVNMTEGELELLTPQQRRIWDANMRNLTFGFDHRLDAKGRPIEQGIGAPGHETENHFRMIRKYEGPEAEKAARAKARGENPKPKSFLKEGHRSADPVQLDDKDGRVLTATSTMAEDFAALKAELEALKAPKTKRRGNPEGLAKARAAAAAKRAAKAETAMKMVEA